MRTKKVNLTIPQRNVLLTVAARKPRDKIGVIEMARIHSILQLLDFEEVEEWYLAKPEDRIIAKDHQKEFTLALGQYNWLKKMLNEEDLSGMGASDVMSTLEAFGIKPTEDSLWDEFDYDEEESPEAATA